MKIVTIEFPLGDALLSAVTFWKRYIEPVHVRAKTEYPGKSAVLGATLYGRRISLSLNCGHYYLLAGTEYDAVPEVVECPECHKDVNP